MSRVLHSGRPVSHERVTTLNIRRTNAYSLARKAARTKPRKSTQQFPRSKSTARFQKRLSNTRRLHHASQTALSVRSRCQLLLLLYAAHAWVHGRRSALRTCLRQVHQALVDRKYVMVLGNAWFFAQLTHPQSNQKQATPAVHEPSQTVVIAPTFVAHRVLQEARLGRTTTSSPRRVRMWLNDTPTVQRA